MHTAGVVLRNSLVHMVSCSSAHLSMRGGGGREGVDGERSLKNMGDGMNVDFTGFQRAGEGGHLVTMLPIWYSLKSQARTHPSMK